MNEMQKSNQVQVASQVQQAKEEKGATTYDVAGQTVKLSYKIVRDYLTKGNGTVSDQDVVQFISVCKFNQLNPFLNEAYLIKYGQQPAQMVVSKEALLKRADSCPNYEGMRAGIIIIRNNEVLEVEGCFYLDSDVLVGGWAEVYRADKKFPFISKVKLSEYDKKQSIWNEKKSTMISKIAKVQALREAFPAQLGAMYTSEESTIRQDVDAEVREEKVQFANTQEIDMSNEQEEAAKVQVIVPEHKVEQPKDNKPNPGF